MASWFRSWHGAPTDNKWLVVANRAKVKPGIVSAVAWALMDYASQEDERGSVAGFDAETYAVFSGFEESDIEAVITAMRDKGIIATDDKLSAWDKRQPKREDDSTERVREYRERQKSVTRNDSVTVTQCNADERSVTHGNNTDTDTDTDHITTPTTLVATSATESLSEQFHTLNECLKTASNKTAKLGEIYALCFGAESVPAYSYIGKAAKQVGGAGRLAQLMFELITRPPAGDVLAFIMAEENSRRKRAAQMGGNREIKEIIFANGDGDHD